MFFRLGVLLLAIAWMPVMAQDCHVTQGWAAMDSTTIEVQQTERIVSLAVRRADERNERAAGYQWICQAQAQGSAVLFVFPKTISSSFHMRNVFVPLDIYFFDESGHQVDARVMRPEPPGSGLKPRYYQAAAPFRYALEIARPQTHDLDTRPAPMRLLIDSL